MKIQFTDYEIDSQEIVQQTPNRSDVPWGPHWTRVEVSPGRPRHSSLRMRRV